MSEKLTAPTLEIDSTVEQIAIVGIGCRFPGADGPEEFWQLLRSGVDATCDIPTDRFDVDSFYDPRRGIPGKMYTRRGGYLCHPPGFDTSFFGVSPREAARIDPQQQMLLEVTWEALEDAGMLREDLANSQAGVFVGMWVNDFDDLLGLEPSCLDLYCVTGGSRFSASGRLSYFLGLEGPSMTTDTACSSSLTAIHLACQSLRAGECPIAFAGGSNLILHPQSTISMCQANVLAGDGRCKFGSANGDGFGRGEGVAMVVLKPYAQARRDGNTIYALIRGTAVNNNGRSSGLLVTPGDRTQTAVFEQACAVAGVSPAEVQYVEAHGTGTAVGDPIEIKALAAALTAAGRSREDPCLIGSVKSNIAHSEGAAGVAGLIKVALSLKHRQIPPSLYCEELNPALPWDELPVEMCRELRPFPSDGRRVLAGINSFGLAGSNAHAILEAVKVESSARGSKVAVATAVGEPELLLLSTCGPAALAERARQIHDWLGQSDRADPFDLGELCATSAMRRSHFDHRLAVTGTSVGQIREKLAAFADGESRLGLVSGRAAVDSATRLVFVFPGQGSQWLGMGRRLFATELVFRRAVERCDVAIEKHVGWSVLAELAADEATSRLGEMAVVQPILFAIEVALAELWCSWGVEPDAVVGHSMGEVAAAHVAGILDLDDAARIICLRSRLLQRMSGRGAMALIELSLEDSRREINGLEDRVSIAVSNSATSTVLAGDSETIQEIIDRLEARDVFCRRVNVPIAAHSPQIDPLQPELLRLLDELRPRPAERRFFSTVLSAFVDGPELDAEYWSRNLRQPVFFADALERLIEDSHRHFLEISPHPILLPAIKEALERARGEGVAAASLRRGEDEKEMLLSTVAEFYVAGRPIAWQRLHAGRRGRVKMPRYPWQRERFEIEGANALRWGNAGAGPSGGHPLLGPARYSATEPCRVCFDLQLSSSAASFLADHRVQGEVLLPAAAMIELALSATRQIFGSHRHRLEQVSFERVLVLDRESLQEQAVQLILEHQATTHRDWGEQRAKFSIYSSLRADREPGPPDAWRLHSKGAIRIVDGPADVDADEPIDLSSQRGEEITGDQFYRRLAIRGYDYGQAFQGLERTWSQDGETLARLRSAAELGLAVGGFALHPALLDAAFQASLAPTETGATHVPVGLESLRILRQPNPASALWSRARARPGSLSKGATNRDEWMADIEVVDEEGRLVATARGLRFQALDAAVVVNSNPDRWLYAVSWRPVERSASTVGSSGRWLLLSDASGLGDRLGAELENRGAGVESISVADAPDPVEVACRVGLALAGQPWRGVVHLASCDAALLVDSDREALERAWDLGSCSVLGVVHALSSLDAPPRLWLVTRAAQPVLLDESPEAARAGVVGLGRVIANEHPELRPVRIDLSHESSETELSALADELLGEPGGDEIALRRHERYEPHLHAYEPLGVSCVERSARRVEPDSEPFQLVLDQPGVLDGLELRPASSRVLEPGEVEIDVVAAGLNFRDVLVALGSIPDPSGALLLGLECAGRITAVGEGVDTFAFGDEVVAIAPRAFASRVVTAATLVAPKPEGLTLEEAATVPIAFATAYHALIDLARLRNDDKVLIHSAAGGVGLAAVRIARAIGAEIFATAGQPDKRAYLRSLGIRHVMDSRSFDFADQVMEATVGAGVDVVLNSLAGEGIPRGISCLAPYGRFLELGKVDFLADSSLGLAPFIRNLSFFGIDLERMYREDHDRFSPLLRDTLRFLKDQDIEPLPFKTVSISRVADAFRLMAQGRHVGKIVVRVAGEAVDLFPGSGALHGNATYLLTGGLGGVGLALAQWMVAQGARHLVLLGRSAPKVPAQEILDRLEATGAELRVVRADVTDEEALAGVFADIADQMPPLRGIVHGAMVLDDGVLRQLDRERFLRVMAPKVIGAWNLDRASRDLALDFFVLFSSAAALVGSPGQGNYVAANAFLDALAHHRRARGLPAVSIAWGPWAEVGAAVGPDRGRRLSERGMASFAPHQGLEIFGRLIQDDNATVVGVMPMHWQRWREAHPAAAEASLLAGLVGPGEASGAVPRVGLIDEMRSLSSDRQLSRLEAFVSATLGKVMGFDPSQIDVAQPIHRMGLDSLMAVELRNRVEREVGVAVSIPKLLQGLSVRQLAMQIRSVLEDERVAPQVDAMTDAQVDELLLEMLAEKEMGA